MKSVIVLAMHGSPPLDFPRRELAEFFALHMRMELAGLPDEERQALSARHDALEKRIVYWPRNGENDPFNAASMKLATDLQAVSGCEVVLGFNEFCAPLLDEALDHACGAGADRVVVVTPMMTRGGEHSERDIPEAIDRARARHPSVGFAYAWPFPPEAVAAFLAEQAGAFLRGADAGGSAAERCRASSGHIRS